MLQLGRNDILQTRVSENVWDRRLPHPIHNAEAMTNNFEESVALLDEY